MRTLALLLILANVCFFFWAHYIDVPEASPIATETPASKRSPRLVLAKERGDSPAVAAQAASELSCISVGPFVSKDELAQLVQRLGAANFTATPRIEPGEVFAGYWVRLQGFATHAQAEQALASLHAGGISDAYILPDDIAANGQPNVVSVGLFNDQARAEQRRDAVAKLGFQPQLQNRMKSGEVNWLDVALQEPGQQLDPTLLQPDSGGIVRLETKPCAGDASSASSSSSSSEAAKGRPG